tara:strand:+ start:1034 stop:2257 length:1224 start_codon:yes stop_codon:yes gene_type:complete
MYTLLKNPTFLLFFLGNIISLIGFGFNLIAISWLVLEKTNSEFALGKIMASATAPGLVLTLFVGIIIDKVNRKWLLVVLDIFRMFVVIGFLFAMNYYEFQLWLLYPVAILVGLGNSLFWPTAQAFVQELVEEKDYFNANKLLSASYQFGSILGAGVGGFIVHYYSPATALWINAVTYFISGIFISLAPFKRDETDHKPEKLFKALSRGFSFLRGKYDILTLGLTTILSDVAIWGALSVLTITISKEIFNKGTWGYGLMDGLYGIGALISTVLVGHMVFQLGRSRSLLLCYGVAGLMCFITPVMPTIYLAATAYFFMGLNNNSARIIIRTLFMENIPNQIMGRVQTIFGVYTRMMVISSALIAGWIIENQSIISGMSFTTLHYVAALLGTLAVLNVWKSPKNILAEAN